MPLKRLPLPWSQYPTVDCGEPFVQPGKYAAVGPERILLAGYGDSTFHSWWSTNFSPLYLPGRIEGEALGILQFCFRFYFRGPLATAELSMHMGTEKKPWHPVAGWQREVEIARLGDALELSLVEKTNVFRLPAKILVAASMEVTESCPEWRCAETVIA